MIYAYDKGIQLPISSIYDTQMMLAQVAAAKDMYEKAAQEMKDFKKEYGDFYSPIQKDMDWYGKNVTGKIQGVINNLYTKGIDPLRSAEGRAEIRAAINSIDPSKINEKKASAAYMTEYNKNMGQLLAAGKYDADQEAYNLYRRFGKQVSPENWDTETMGVWNVYSPIQAKSLKEVTSDFFDQLKARDLTQEDLRSGYETPFDYDSRYDYKGLTYKDILETAGENVPGWQGTFWADYFRDQARKQLITDDNPKPTDEQINRQLQRNVAEANKEFIQKPVKSENKYALEDYKFNNDVKMENIRFGHQKALKDSSGNGSGDKGEIISYGQSLFLRGIQNYSGSPDPGVSGLQSALSFGEYTNGLNYAQKESAFINKYTMRDAESPLIFYSRFKDIPSRVKETSAGGVNIDTSYDLRRIYSRDELTSSTLGWTGVVIPTDRNAIKQQVKTNANNDMSTEMHATGSVYTAPMRNGSHEQYVEIDITGMDQPYYYLVTKSDPQPTEQSSVTSTPWNTSSASTDVFAPHGFGITPSQESRGWWGAQDNAIGEAAGMTKDKSRNSGGFYIGFE